MSRYVRFNVVLKLLGGLLIVAAILKSHQILTQPVLYQYTWFYRVLTIVEVECELALGIWLLSPIFRGLAWLAGVACFGFFCVITLYKALTGASSCGCFGQIHVNPWITFLVIDMPAVVVLIALRPENAVPGLRHAGVNILRALKLLYRILRHVKFSVKAGVQCSHFTHVLGRLLAPARSREFQTTMCAMTIILACTLPVFISVKPARATGTYEVLEPKTWLGREPPILDHVSIADELRTGIWVAILYRHDCAHCLAVLPKCRDIASVLRMGEYGPRLATIEIPPYGPVTSCQEDGWLSGRLDESKEWFVATPATILTIDGRVEKVYEKEIPAADDLLIDTADRTREGRIQACSWRSHMNPDSEPILPRETTP